MTSAGANTWSIPLEINNLESQISSAAGSGVLGITSGNSNITITGTPQNPILSGTLTNLTSNVNTSNFALSGNSGGNPSFVIGGTEEFKVITTDLTPHIIVGSGVGSVNGVQLGLPSGYGGYQITAPTPTPATLSDDQVATTAFVQNAITSSANDLQQVLTNGNTTTLDINLTATNTTHTITPNSTSDVVFNVGTSGLGRIDTQVAEGNAQLFMAAGTAGSSNSLRTEITTSGGVLIDHETIAGTVQSMVLQSEGSIRMKGGISGIQNEIICSNGASGIVMNGAGLTVNSLAGTVNTLTAGVNVLSASTNNQFNAGTTAGNANPNIFLSSGAGGALNPMVRIENTNATGSCAMEIYKNKPTAVIAGDVLYNQSVFGKDATNAKQEYTRISHTIRGAVAGNEQGSIQFGCFVAGANADFIQINGNENQVNILKQLDMGGNSITASTGTLPIITTGTATNITIQPQAENDILLTTTGVSGNIVMSASSGGQSTIVNTTYNSQVCQTTGLIRYRTTGSSPIDLQSQGVGGINIDANNTGAGGSLLAKGAVITLATADGTPGSGAGLLLTGDTLLSASAGGSSGQHLCLTIGGTVYKIKLENP
jgi:hypothetical protein